MPSLAPTFSRATVSALLISLAWISSPAFAEAPSSEPLAAIGELGKLNGIALACGKTALTTRLRDIIVTVAPKSREIGETYEQASNAAFLAQGRGQACPDGRTLAKRIEAAEARLKAAYPQ